MKALLKEKQDEFGFKLREVKAPRARPNEVTIRVRAAGICGSDVTLYKGLYPTKLPVPYIPGHEFSGEAHEIGSEVKRIRVGDKVSADIVIGCGNCWYCLNGKRHLCQSSKEMGFDVNGAFAEYLSFPESNIHLLPSQMTYEEGAMLDPLSSALHPLENLTFAIRDRVMVIGDGAIGMLAVQCLRSMGASEIILVGKHGERLAKGAQLGADVTIDMQEKGSSDAIKKIKDKGIDIVVEASGDSDAVETAFRTVRKAGQVALVGVYHKPSTIDATNVVYKELSIYGSYCYTWSTFERAIDLVSSSQVKVNPLISQILPLTEFDVAFTRILNREVVKIVLKP